MQVHHTVHHVSYMHMIFGVVVHDYHLSSTKEIIAVAGRVAVVAGFNSRAVPNRAMLGDNFPVSSLRCYDARARATIRQFGG